MQLDILAFGAHPDDVELGCGGTLASHIAMGKKIGVVDFTQGEMGTRGNPELRLEEAGRSAKILGLEVRKNLGFDDVYFENDKSHQIEVAKVIRKYRPRIILANAVKDRHPDHGRAAALVNAAVFISGLSKVVIEMDGELLDPWRPSCVYNYIQSIYHQPDFIVDISGHWDRKLEAINCYKSQFFDPKSDEPETYISSKNFMKMIESRAVEFGHSIGADHGEGFTVNRNIGVKEIHSLT